MKPYILLLLPVLFIMNCSSPQVKDIDPISFPYELITNETIAVKECLNMTNSRGCERISWELSMIGEYQKTLECWNVTNQNVYVSKKDSILNLKEYSIIPAKEKLLQRIKDERVVMFNEAHHLPSHRITTMSYLEELYELGFRYLGMEALKEEGHELMMRGEPSISSGYYLKEPQYSNLIKKAIALGYTVFNYDEGGHRKEREINQANKIAEVFEKDYSAKVLIHAGWGHIREDTIILNGLMAYEFKKKTGIDPFTINQTRFNEQSERKYEHVIYQHLESFDEPSILVNNINQEIYTDSITDIILFHPRSQTINSRPDYLKNSQLFHSKVIRFDKYIHNELLILAYDNSEKTAIEERTAIDVCVKKKGIDKIELFFPFKGDYIVYAIDSIRIIKNIQHI